MSSISPEPTLGSSAEIRVGLLFLVCGNLNQPEIWADYIEKADGRCSVYCHAKYPEAIQSGPLAGKCIEEHHATSWGDVSLVRAMIALLRAGLEDPSLTHFMFLSENCIPIKPVEQLLETLTQDKRSRFDATNIYEAYARRWEKAARFRHHPHIPFEHRHFQAQWVLLERDAARILADNDWVEAFRGVFAADECYFSTVLSICGWNIPKQVVRSNPTWCRWSGGSAHPWTLHRITPGLRQEWDESDCFFARKIPHDAIWEQKSVKDAKDGAAIQSPVIWPRSKHEEIIRSGDN